MKLVHNQPEPLELKSLDPMRLPYMWKMLQKDTLAFDDYCPLTWEEFVLFVISTRSVSWEIGDGVGLTTLVFDGTNAYIAMVMFDWNYRDYIADQVIQQAFARGATRVTSIVTEDRKHARRLVERHGGKLEAIMRKSFLREGQYLDTEVYGLLREEYKWQQQQ